MANMNNNKQGQLPPSHAAKKTVRRYENRLALRNHDTWRTYQNAMIAMEKNLLHIGPQLIVQDQNKRLQETLAKAAALNKPGIELKLDDLPTEPEDLDGFNDAMSVLRDFQVQLPGKFADMAQREHALLGELAEVKKTVERHNIGNKGLLDKGRKLQEENKTLQAQNQNLQDQIKGLTDRKSTSLPQLGQHNTSLEQRIGTLIKKKETMSTNFDKQIKAKDELIDIFKETIRKANSEQNRAANHQNQNMQLTHLNDQVTELSKMVKNREQDKTLPELQAELNKVRRELSNAEQKVQDLQRTSEKSAKEAKTRLEKEIQSLDARHTTDTEHRRKEFEFDRHKLQQNVATLNKNLKDLVSKAEGLLDLSLLSKSVLVIVPY
jgi:myosin heavy subunit